MKLDNSYITQVCEKCNGEGSLLTRFGLSLENTEPCWVCKGLGKTPNAMGREILELVNYFGRKR